MVIWRMHDRPKTARNAKELVPSGLGGCRSVLQSWHPCNFVSRSEFTIYASAQHTKMTPVSLCPFLQTPRPYTHHSFRENWAVSIPPHWLPLQGAQVCEGCARWEKQSSFSDCHIFQQWRQKQPWKGNKVHTPQCPSTNSSSMIHTVVAL